MWTKFTALSVCNKCTHTTNAYTYTYIIVIQVLPICFVGLGDMTHVHVHVKLIILSTRLVPIQRSHYEEIEEW